MANKGQHSGVNFVQPQNLVEAVVKCPRCNIAIKVTESLAAPFIEAMRQEYEHKVSRQAAAIANNETVIRHQQTQITAAQGSVDDKVAAALEIERERIGAAETKKARLLIGIDLEQRNKEIETLHDVLRDRDKKLAEAQRAHARLIQRERELDDASRELDLTIEKRVQQALPPLRVRAQQEAEESLRLKLFEKEELIRSMQSRIDDLKSGADQGSQQLQGEAQELQLESLLRLNFPDDVLEPVAIGARGGDLLHRILGPQGQACGTILWECKRTKTWNHKWLSKLRDDQRDAKADFALLISKALPKSIETFGSIDGVWITASRYSLPLAVLLRQYLVEISTLRQVSDGQQTKMKMVYQYLTGPRFRQRVEAIIEKFSDMQSDLGRERQIMMRSWAKREEQIRRVVEATAGMYGDFEGIAGGSLREIEALQTPLLGCTAEIGCEPAVQVPRERSPNCRQLDQG